MPLSSFSESQQRQPSIPTAQARLQGLQADPRRLASAHAAHEKPVQDFSQRSCQKTCPNGPAESDDCHSVSVPLRCTPPESQSSSLHNSLPLELKKSGLETFVFFPRQILRTPRFCLRTKSLRSLCKISSSKSQKTPACCAPNPTGAMNVREQVVPRPKVSAFRPKNNIIGPKLCNRLPPSSLA